MKKIVAYSEPLEETRADGSVGISGDGVNFTVGAKRLAPVIAAFTGNHEPVSVGLLTAIGTDQRGFKIHTFLRENEIDTQFIRRIADKKSAAYTISGDGGARNFTFQDREDSAVRHLFEEPHIQTVRNCVNHFDYDTIFVVSGIGASRPLNDKAFDRLLQTVDEAKKRGAHIVVDPNMRLKLWPDADTAKYRLRQLIAKADTVFITSPDDTQYLIDDKTSPDTVAAEIKKRGARQVIVKLGERGSYLFTENGRKYRIPAFPAEAIDSTGAGDTFMAGTLMAVAHGVDWPEAAIIGSRAASRVVQHAGGVLQKDFVPALEQLEKDLGPTRAISGTPGGFKTANA